jgi:hypothetical protein
MLERDVELEYLSARLGGTRGGHGGVVAIEGPAGIGKSRLLAATVAVAGELGLGVLRARGGELEAGIAFGVARQLFEPAVLSAGKTERRRPSCQTGDHSKGRGGPRAKPGAGNGHGERVSVGPNTGGDRR